MSNNITIKKLLDLDEDIFTKMSDITLEATITRALKSREVKGSKDGRDYHFFSQFVVVNDSTADIGMDLVVGKAEEAFTRDAKIKIEKARTAVYKDKNDETQRKLTKGKVILLNGQRIPSGEAAISTNDYYIVVGPNNKIVLNPEVDKEKRLQLLREGIAKSFIETTGMWNEIIERQAQTSFAWVAGKEKSKHKSKAEIEGEQRKKDEEFEGLIDKDFDRDEIIKSFLKAFGELFVAGKTKGLNLGEWLTKKYQVELPVALTDDQVAELPSAVDEMRKKE